VKKAEGLGDCRWEENISARFVYINYQKVPASRHSEVFGEASL